MYKRKIYNDIIIHKKRKCNDNSSIYLSSSSNSLSDDIKDIIEDSDDDNNNDNDFINIINNNIKLLSIKLFKYFIRLNNEKSTEEQLESIKKEINNFESYNIDLNNLFYKKFEKEIKYYYKLYDYLKSNKDNLINNLDILEYQINNNDKYKKDFFDIYYSIFNYNCNIKEDNIYEYFNNLDSEHKINLINKLKSIKIDNNNKPNIIKILESNTTNNNKSIILSKLNQLDNIYGSSEYYKLKSWTNGILKIPFDNYINPPVNNLSSKDDIKKYLDNLKSSLDDNIYGHESTKEQLIKLLAFNINNPNEGGNVFALEGPPGVGKTAIIHDCISKVLNRPFAFISLGGATDSSYLVGHDYTYEGSHYGKIVNILIETKCMNPIIYFDELDKISDTARGEEIINILMHLTDSTQNFVFNDKYFRDIELNLSKAILIFSYNSSDRISPILLDRMKIIKIKGYKLEEKIIIVKKFILPKLFKSFNLNSSLIIFSDNIIEYIIESYTNEAGVRKIKELLFDILLEINIRLLTKIYDIDKPIYITKQLIDTDILKKKLKIESIKIFNRPKIGLINGLWANSYGLGGILPIECSWLLNNNKLELELTGMQGEVMQESMMVARTVAWKTLPNKIKSDIIKSKFTNGIHIHCPDGATPKDGPSAGVAITICLISLFTNTLINNNIAITGEINLKGNITAIGGLEEKIYGAKKADVKLIICPEENKKDIENIKLKYPKLFNENFNIKTVNNIWEVLDIVLINNKLKFFNF